MQHMWFCKRDVVFLYSLLVLLVERRSATVVLERVCCRSKRLIASVLNREAVMCYNTVQRCCKWAETARRSICYGCVDVRSVTALLYCPRVSQIDRRCTLADFAICVLTWKSVWWNWTVHAVQKSTCGLRWSIFDMSVDARSVIVLLCCLHVSQIDQRCMLVDLRHLCYRAHRPFALFEASRWPMRLAGAAWACHSRALARTYSRLGDARTHEYIYAPWECHNSSMRNFSMNTGMNLFLAGTYSNNLRYIATPLYTVFCCPCLFIYGKCLMHLIDLFCFYFWDDSNSHYLYLTLRLGFLKRKPFFFRSSTNYKQIIHFNFLLKYSIHLYLHYNLAFLSYLQSLSTWWMIIVMTKEIKCSRI